MNIQAIETKYNGVLFRSRTEARWAMLFDELGVRWAYEEEAYELNPIHGIADNDRAWIIPRSVSYLPDFTLIDADTFIEVKGSQPTLFEEQKCATLALETGNVVILVFGQPNNCKAIVYSQSENFDESLYETHDQASEAAKHIPIELERYYAAFHVCARCSRLFVRSIDDDWNEHDLLKLIDKKTGLLDPHECDNVCYEEDGSGLFTDAAKKVALHRFWNPQ